MRLDWLRRVMAVLAGVALLAFPVRTFLALEGIPWQAKGAWLLAAAAAWRWPWPSLLAFAASAPLLPIVPSLYHWPSVSLPSAWLWALLLPAWLALAVRPSRPALPRAAAALLLVASASLVAALYPLSLARDGVAGLLAEAWTYLNEELPVATSQRPPMAPVLAWLTLAEGLGLLWLVMRALREDSARRIAWLAAAMSAGAGLVGAWGVHQWWTGRHLLEFWILQDPYIVRVNASFTDVNALGAYLASALPLVVAVALWRPEPRWRGAWLAAAAVAMVSIVFTASRVAWLAALVGLSGFAVTVLFWRIGSWSTLADARLRRVAGAVAVLACVVFASLTAWATARDVRFLQQRTYADTILYTLNLRAPFDERLKGRGELWEAALRMIAARPVTGIGLGRYFKDVSAWTPRPDELIRPQENAHNYFLQVGAELGLPGAALLALLVAAAVVNGLAAAGSAGLAAVRRIGLAAGWGVAAFLLTCLTGHSLLLREGQLTFWSIAGLALAAPAALGRPGTPGRRASLASAGLVTLATVLAITLPLRVRAEMARVMTRLDLTGFVSGVYPEERSPTGSTFRWTGPRAVFRAPADARAITLEVRGVAPFPQTLGVLHEGRLIQEVPLRDPAWRTLRFVLPLATPRERFRTFELRVEPTWRPPDDDRELGVMVGAIGWMP